MASTNETSTTTDATAASKQKPKPKQKKEKKPKPVPFCEPYFHASPSPFYKQTHMDFQKKCRAFVEKEIMPYVDKWDEEGTYPKDLALKMAAAKLLSPQYPVEYGGTPPENFDNFHMIIFLDEFARCGCGGLMASVFSFNIALPCIIHAGSKEIKDRVARDVIEGRKNMALCVTEPNGGSDVANLQTNAVEDETKENYIVNGEKYFITSGMKADYFVVAVRTGKPGFLGVSLLLIEGDRKGVIRSRMKTMGWWASNTAYIIFKDVVVPKKNLIGIKDYGFLPIMMNFNQERMGMVIQTNRYARICLEESIRYARERQTFGKRLADHQVIRHKIAEIARNIGAVHAWIEQVTFRYERGENPLQLISDIALLKVQSTRTFELAAREAVQIFGGRGYLRGGRGSKVERLYREVRVMAIAGGSEEIMLDLAARQAKL